MKYPDYIIEAAKAASHVLEKKFPEIHKSYDKGLEINTTFVDRLAMGIYIELICAQIIRSDNHHEIESDLNINRQIT